MNILDDILSDDFVALTDTDLFGESVVYTTKAGVAKTVSAVVRRQQPSAAGDSGKLAMPMIDVFISRDATVGITTTPNVRADHITTAWNIGETARRFTVMEIISQDTGGWWLRCH